MLTLDGNMTNSLSTLVWLKMAERSSAASPHIQRQQHATDTMKINVPKNIRPKRNGPPGGRPWPSWSSVAL